MRVKAISLYEPWATLMALRAKRNETRGWPTGYRGPLLICASVSRDPDDLELLTDACFQAALAPLLGAVPGHEFAAPREVARALVGKLSFGKATCLVTLVSCRRSRGDCTPDQPPASLRGTEVWRRWLLDEHHFGNYAPGRWVWETTNVRLPREPFPVRGRQGLFEVEIPGDLFTLRARGDGA